MGLLSLSAAAQTATTTALSITAAGSTVATAPAKTVVTLTATVLSGSMPVTTGQVNFCDATAAHCTAIHLLGSAQLTSAGTSTLKFIPGIGSHSYKAVFAGTNSNAASSSNASPLAVTGTHPTTTAIAYSGNAGNYSLTATVTGIGIGPILPIGTVSFLDTTNSTVLGTQPLVTGTSTFGFFNSATPATSLLPIAIAVGDFNGDGIADMAVVNEGDWITPGTLTIFLGKGDGTFTAAAASPTTAIGSAGVVAGDFNGDGKLDLAVANQYSNTVTILLGNGDGTFTPASSPATGPRPFSLATGDFNGDGKQDLAIANMDDGTITVLLGNGTGTFTAAPNIAAAPRTLAEPIAVGDFNGDGLQDIAVGLYGAGNTLSIWLGNGDGTFTAGQSLRASSYPIGIAVEDFNGDGKLDLAVADGNGNTISMLFGKGDGTFITPVTTIPTSAGEPEGIAVGDFNGDGKPDLALADFSGSTAVILLGNGDGTFTESTPSPATGSHPTAVAVGDFNGDGLPDLALANYRANTATVLLSQFAETGTATINNVSVTPAGSGVQQVDASYSGDSVYSPSISGTIGLSALVAVTTSTITSSPSSTTYGNTFTLTATVVPPASATQAPTGTVDFSIDGAVVASGVALSADTASAVIPVGNTYAVGVHSLTAVYSGDTNFSSSSAVGSHAVYPEPADFTFTIAQNPFPVGVGLTSSVAVNVTAINGWTADVTLACPAKLPYDFTCTLQQTTIAGGNGNTTLTLTTVAPHNCGNNPPYFTGTAQLEMRLGTAVMAGLIFFMIPRRRRIMKTLLLAVLCVLPGVVGCAGNCTDLGTYPGTYSVPITATGVGTSTSHTVDLQVVVKL
ncbi:MAG TPA: FG-GAP-like repeat-containing protein [Acidobacteriaceae bacterium]